MKDNTDKISIYQYDPMFDAMTSDYMKKTHISRPMRPPSYFEVVPVFEEEEEDTEDLKKACKDGHSEVMYTVLRRLHERVKKLEDYKEREYQRSLQAKTSNQ